MIPKSRDGDSKRPIKNKLYTHERIIIEIGFKLKIVNRGKIILN
jgi:hypothetical protein